MHRIETYLRLSMTQTRLNNVMVVHVHKHLTDSVDCVKVLMSLPLPMRIGKRISESFEILLLSHVVLFCYVFCNMYVCLCSFVCSVRGTLA